MTGKGSLFALSGVLISLVSLPPASSPRLQKAGRTAVCMGKILWKLMNLDWYWPILYMWFLIINTKWQKGLCHGRSLYIGASCVLIWPLTSSLAWGRRGECWRRGTHYPSSLPEVKPESLGLRHCIFLFLFWPLMPVNCIRKAFLLSLTG